MEEFRKDPKKIYTNFGPKMGFIGSQDYENVSCPSTL